MDANKRKKKIEFTFPNQGLRVEVQAASYWTNFGEYILDMRFLIRDCESPKELSFDRVAIEVWLENLPLDTLMSKYYESQPDSVKKGLTFYQLLTCEPTKGTFVNSIKENFKEAQVTILIGDAFIYKGDTILIDTIYAFDKKLGRHAHLLK